MRAMSASSRGRHRHRQPPPHSEQRIHHAAGISQKMLMTGQTGSGQARLTLGGSIRRCPRDKEWSPAERFASGSAPHAHHAPRATRPSSDKQSAPRSCPSTPPAFASTVSQRRGHQRRIQIPLVKKRKSLQRVRRRPCLRDERLLSEGLRVPSTCLPALQACPSRTCAGRLRSGFGMAAPLPAP
jgi:hypothetical protein